MHVIVFGKTTTKKDGIQLPLDLMVLAIDSQQLVSSDPDLSDQVLVHYIFFDARHTKT